MAQRLSDVQWCFTTFIHASGVGGRVQQKFDNGIAVGGGGNVQGRVSLMVTHI